MQGKDKFKTKIEIESVISKCVEEKNGIKIFNRTNRAQEKKKRNKIKHNGQKNKIQNKIVETNANIWVYKTNLNS